MRAGKAGRTANLMVLHTLLFCTFALATGCGGGGSSSSALGSSSGQIEQDPFTSFDHSWVDTQAQSSLVEDDSLFRLAVVDNTLAYSSASTAANIHSHYVDDAANNWPGTYTFDGRIRLDGSSGGAGVTFLSAFPSEARYYRLSANVGSNFRVVPSGAGILTGDSDSGVLLVDATWYRFVVDVEDSANATMIRAKVWLDGTAEPSAWDIDCVDTSSSRQRMGTVGCWSTGASVAYFADFSVGSDVVDFPQPYDVTLETASEELYVGETTPIAVVARYDDGDLPLTSVVNWSNVDPVLLAIAADNTITPLTAGTSLITAQFAGLSTGLVAITAVDAQPVAAGSWLDTTSGGFVEDPMLHKVVRLGSDLSLRTASTLINIHTHFQSAEASQWEIGQFTGRLRVSDESGGIGVTFASAFPDVDSYYRFRRFAGTGFHMAPHATSLAGDLDSEVVPDADTWYAFRIVMVDTGMQTEIRARIWPESEAEPWTWSIDCYDDSATRLTTGTIGGWSMGPGSKYWGKLAVDGSDVPLPQPETLQVAASSSTLVVGEIATLTMTGQYVEGALDLTPEAEWNATPSGLVVLTPGSPAQLQGFGGGLIDVSASYGAVTSPTIGIEVIDPTTGPSLADITITGPAAPLNLGETTTVIATGHMSDGSSVDLTGSVSWAVTDTSVASITPGSPTLVTATLPGVTDLTANFAGVTSAPLTIEVVPPPAVLMSIQLEGPTAPLSITESSALQATGYYDDGTVSDVTPLVAYDVSDSTVAEVSTMSPILVTAIGAGSTTITATLSGVTSAPISIEVIVPLVSLELVVVDSLLSIGDTTEIEVLGTYSDGTVITVTDQVSWWVGNDTVISVAPGSPATVTAVAAGTALIAASLSSVGSDQIEIEVAGGAPTLTALVLSTSQSELQFGEFAQLTLTGTFSDGSSVDLTAVGIYSATPTDILYFFPPPSLPGAAIAVNPGTADVTSTFLGMTSNSVGLTVIDPAGPPSLPDVAPWIDTQSGSLLVDDSLFAVGIDGSDPVITTDSIATNIHSHLAAPDSLSLSYQTFTGRMKIGDPDGSIGVTMFSQYPAEDAYYRLRRYAGTSFHIAPHGTSISGGDTSASLTIEADTWYEFRVELEDTGRTEIRARVWAAGTSEPTGWAIDCWDNNATRLTTGTVGAWSMGPGSKSWGELSIDSTPVPLPDEVTLELTISDTVLEVGDLTQMSVTSSDGFSTDDVTADVDWIITPSTALVATGSTPGQVEALEPGVVTVYVEHDGHTSQSVNVTIFPEAGSGGSGFANQLSNNGITWYFDQDYPVGEFVTGDPWVMGPVTIVGIDPPSTTQASSGRVTHGSMLDPLPDGTIHGYDSGLFGGFAGTNYHHDLNVAYGVSPSDPLVISGTHSLVSTISPSSSAGSPPGIVAAAVLTIVATPPAGDSFRPPYSGPNKPFYTVSGLDLSQLGTIPAIGGQPSVGDIAEDFEYPWLDHVGGWLGRFAHPEQNMPDYGREMAIQIGRAAVFVNTDMPLGTKMPVLVGFMQLGIDLDGVFSNGGRWHPDGGHSSGRKFPILFKRAMVGEDTDLGVGPTAFGEEGQTFIVEETSPGVYNYGFGGFGSGQVGMPEWGNLYWTQSPLGSSSNFLWYADNYRRCCTYNAMAGHFLSAIAMGLRDDWDWEPAFLYMDRYMQLGSGWERQYDVWTRNVWDMHRDSYPDYDPVPPSWIPSDL